ncbi:FMN-dependent NADH-azoreductase [Chryseobacterium aquaticum]|uniref:FMN dependent NADH:quinone oxidoreductase n=1 Tax=Chryseobacterium aquaticum TaxID=452084 RepID=A0A848NAX6_9FLAO|nr:MULTISPECIES: NAD(P)H-dependent oxidoreductase [Chryseobacterium]NMR35710.1 FMN-dependent NADH-azoreductase [Chryseobacterium aquaticum]NRQ47843.1 NAD(P)H-dependent oxidoreductase [Chryseobacterium sp. C-204]
MNNNAHIRPLEILRLDSSSRYADSVSRNLTDYFVARLLKEYPEAKVTTRDLAAGLPLPTEDFVDGSLYSMENPTPVMQTALQLSNEMVTELISADLVVLGMPLYNWTVPSTFKSYIDHVSRLNTTFEYVDGVSEGLLRARSVYIIFTSGGTGIGSEKDFATPYAKYLWQTLGIQNVHIIDASGILFNTEERIHNAKNQIDQLVLPVFA